MSVASRRGPPPSTATNGQVVQHATINRLKYQPALDGVRALAIGAVMGGHIAFRFFRGGTFGVDVFFVLSAFLITSLILEETTDRDGGYGFRAFYARRARRLGPALVVWLVALAVPTAIAAGQADRIIPSTLAALFYVGNLAVADIVHLPVGDGYIHIWSLANEEQFYAIWPLIVVFLVARRTSTIRRRLLICLVMLAPVVHSISATLIGTTYFLPTGHVAPIAVGCLAAELFTFGLPRRTSGLLAHALFPPACLAVLGLVVLRGYPDYGPVSGVVATAVVAVATGGLVLHLCAERAVSPTTRILSSAPMVWIGRRSYGLYLYHWTITVFVSVVLPGRPLRVTGPLIVAVSLTTAALSYRFIEHPIIAAGRRTHGRPHRSLVTPDPTPTSMARASPPDRATTVEGE